MSAIAKLDLTVSALRVGDHIHRSYHIGAPWCQVRLIRCVDDIGYVYLDDGTCRQFHCDEEIEVRRGVLA